MPGSSRRASLRYTHHPTDFRPDRVSVLSVSPSSVLVSRLGLRFWDPPTSSTLYPTHLLFLDGFGAVPKTDGGEPPKTFAPGAKLKPRTGMSTRH